MFLDPPWNCSEKARERGIKGERERKRERERERAKERLAPMELTRPEKPLMPKATLGVSLHPFKGLQKGSLVF